MAMNRIAITGKSDGVPCYAGLFMSALLAATILRMQSEAVLSALHASGAYSAALLIAVASIGNILGALINWFLGRGIERFRGRAWFPEAGCARSGGRMVSSLWKMVASGELAPHHRRSAHCDSGRAARAVVEFRDTRRYR